MDIENKLIPVMKPLLPSAEQIGFYMRKIDASRNYTNFGPLENLLTQRLAEMFGTRETEVLLVSSGTLALMGAVTTESSEIGDSWAVPAWTFVASAHAVASTGRQLEVCDVSSTDWRLDSAKSSSAKRFLVTLPFGDSPPAEPVYLESSGSRLRCPTIYDGASCFDAYVKSKSKIPTSKCVSMISLHATKLVSTGEGAVLVGDESWITEIKKWINFGFFGTRTATRPAVNAKMSEYNAAVGLASLDQWQSTRAALERRFSRYRDLAGRLGFQLQPSASKGFVTSTIIVKLDSQQTRETLAKECSSGEVETRDWWGPPISELNWVDSSSKLHPVAKELSLKTLGLPLFVDLDESHFDRIEKALSESIKRQ